MRRDWVGSDDDDDCVKLVQWNILSQTLGVVGDFSVCPLEALSWEYRKPLLVQELLSHKADLLCLEEVDCFPQLSSELQSSGYAGIWVPKSDSPCLQFQPNMGPDGNALFYSKTKFTLSKTYHHILTLKNGVKTNSTVLVAELEHIKTKELISVLVTHLKAKETKENQEIRSQQASHILQIIPTLPTDKIILVGDFNASPEEPIYQLIQEAGFVSAYYQTMAREPDYTTWKIRGSRGSSPVGEKKRVIDFVFYRGNELKAMAVLDVPSEEALGVGKLPNATFPSDHMSLAVKFSL